ncbi:MAG: hypothetical protein DLM59_19225 [Pseudonocardiales bacterium]|nr:MAG: hypothetical protein DLM59_19225 [Pseudonocardiales bacterium]
MPTGTRVESAIARCKVAATTSTATLDGKPLRVNEADSGGAFDLLSKPGSTTLPAGKHSVVAWGLWVGPVALTPGQHTVTLSGRAGSFETSVTYHLSVG